jgi:integrase
MTTGTAASYTTPVSSAEGTPAGSWVLPAVQNFGGGPPICPIWLRLWHPADCLTRRPDKVSCRWSERRITIGDAGAWSVRAAQERARELRRMVDSGDDPVAARVAERAAPTLAAFAERYLGEYAALRHRSRTREEEARLPRLSVLPALGTVRLADLSKADAARLHHKLRATPVAANRALALLSAICTWAEKIGERPDNSNPCRHVEKFPERPRARLVSAEELARAEANGIADWRAVALIRLLLFTGARLPETLGLK